MAAEEGRGMIPGLFDCGKLRKIKEKKRDVKYFHTTKTYGSVKIEQMFGKEARAWRIRNVRHL